MSLVEVFKTTVTDRAIAERIVKRIEQQLPGCIANFDLDDCDRILRVENLTGSKVNEVKKIVGRFGNVAEVLDDSIPIVPNAPWAIIDGCMVLS